MYTVQELQEDGGKTAALAGQGLGPAVAEAVPEGQPLLLHQQAEALQRAVVGVREQLHQGDHLQGQGGLEMLVGRWPRAAVASGSGRAPTCVVMSQPSSRLTSTEEPVSRSSTTNTEICRILWICQRKGQELPGCRELICWTLCEATLSPGSG